MSVKVLMSILSRLIDFELIWTFYSQTSIAILNFLPCKIQVSMVKRMKFEFIMGAKLFRPYFPILLNVYLTLGVLQNIKFLR